jgi:hypothetical protein
MARKKPSPQTLIAAGTFGLYERKDRAFIPMLREKTAALRTRIEDKHLQDTADEPRGAD